MHLCLCFHIFPGTFIHLWSKVSSPHSCHCPAGFEGDRCEINIDDCIESKCENNSTCIDLVEQYRCQCHPGFTGEPVTFLLSVSFYHSVFSYYFPQLHSFSQPSSFPQSSSLPSSLFNFPSCLSSFPQSLYLSFKSPSLLYLASFPQTLPSFLNLLSLPSTLSLPLHYSSPSFQPFLPLLTL